MQAQGGPVVRLAELVAVMSYGADLGLGQPLEHCLRQTVIALRLASLVGADEAELEATYYLGLLMNSYCNADAAEQASWVGDEIEFKADGFEMLAMSRPQVAAFMLRRLWSHGTPIERVRRVATFPFVGIRTVESWLSTHVTLGSQLAAQLGLGDLAAAAAADAYEQWDGKGVPGRHAGDGISLPARLVQLAAPVEVLARQHGADSVRAVVRRHAGVLYDPALCQALLEHLDTVLADLDEAASWEAILAAEPSGRQLSGAELDEVLEAMADLADLKSPFFAGHSRGVARLAAEAGRRAGLTEAECTSLRHAGLVHDIGRLGVSNTVWDKPGPLSALERERAHLHPYLTDRMLARVPTLDACRTVAARHHERLDGSGYPGGLTAAALTPADRLLAAADVYHAATEPRPHRPARSDQDAAQELLEEVRAGRLDGVAADAVLEAAGHRATPRRTGPQGLTPREVEVLALLARGLVNKEIGRRLGVSPKTVSRHVEHVYAKIGVGTRAAATLFATQRGLVGSYEPRDSRPRTR
jgi:HD-GYP domain-containing protein (c-di-GMP phosphodiesterase class II)